MKTSTVTFIFVAFAIIVGGFYFSKKPLIIATEPMAQNIIQVSGHGKAQVIPDIFTLHVGVEIQKADTQAQAIEQRNKSINTVKEILQKAGIAEENVQTVNINARESYEYTDGKRVASGYQANEDLTIRIEKEKKVVDEVLDAIGKVSHITIYDIRYSTSDANDASSEARKKALEKARKKAEEIASYSGLKIKKVQSVSEISNNSHYRGEVANAKLMMDNGGIADTGGSNVSVGQMEHDVSLNIVYEVESI